MLPFLVRAASLRGECVLEQAGANTFSTVEHSIRIPSSSPDVP
jgi:hypothetical protein